MNAPAPANAGPNAGTQVSGAAAEADATGTANTTEINLKNAEINAIIRIFSKRTGRNYILDENVKGKVTIFLPGKVSSDEALRILDSILALKGFTSVPIGKNLWKIIPSKDAKNTTIPTRTDAETDQVPSAAVVTRLIQLKYTAADDVKQLITPLVSPEGLVNAYTGTNSLIVIDSEDNIARVAEIVGQIDLPSSDRDMTIIPVLNAAATDIAEKLNELLGSGGQSGNSNSAESALDLLRNRSIETAVARANTPAGGAAVPVSASGKTINARAREPKITADERTNSIIVVADEETTARVRALIAQLDSKVDLSGNRFYVYRCKHASAEELVEVLQGLGGGGSGASGAGTARASTGSNANTGFGDDVLGGSSKSNTSSGSSRNRQRRTPGETRSGSKSGGGGTVSMGENISISADPSTNSLIISSSKQDYEKIKGLLETLDVKRRQVIVEAMLLEVAVDDNRKLGASFATSLGGKDGGMLLRNDIGGDLTKLLSNPASIQDFSVAAASAGSLKLPNGTVIPTQSVLLNAAQNNSSVNVLSSPTILTTDNEEAEIVVGQNVPFLASTSTSETNLNNTFNQIDRQDVGITLRLTPQINSEDFVTLKIFTEVSNVVAATAASALGPTTTVRTSETTVITKDAQMVVIGGLMSDDISDSEQGIPFLKDIPVLGHAFKVTASSHRRNNLLIFITPRIIQDQFDHRDQTIVQRDKMSDSMVEFETYPRRDEVLRNQDIDAVSEAKRWEGEKPSTILPPAPSKSVPSKVVAQAPTQGTIDIDLDKPANEVAEKTEPPAEKTTAAAPERRSEAATAPTAKRFQSNAATTKVNGARFVVVELDNAKALPKGLPFLVDKGTARFGIAMDGDSTTPEVASFFSPGRKIQYELDGSSPVIATVVESFSDEAAARSAVGARDHAAVPWYRLSPYEVLGLGNAPWRSAE